MQVSLPLVFTLWALQATAAWAGAWSEPGQVLGLPWGVPVETVRGKLPEGKFWTETPLTATYSTTVIVESIPVSVAFQFVSQQGLQGVMFQFAVNRLEEMVIFFERQYGRSPIRANRQWQWEGTGVRISLGEYPTLGPPRGRRGIAWIRTRALEEAIARGEEARRALAEQGTPLGHAAPPADWGLAYEERILRKIYGALRYPATTRGVYLVSLALQLTPAGRAATLKLTVDPPNPDVAESVRAAVGRAQPFPSPPAGARGSQDQPLRLTLTVTIFP